MQIIVNKHELEPMVKAAKESVSRCVRSDYNTMVRECLGKRYGLFGRKVIKTREEARRYIEKTMPDFLSAYYRWYHGKLKSINDAYRAVNVSSGSGIAIDINVFEVLKCHADNAKKNGWAK